MTIPQAATVRELLVFLSAQFEQAGIDSFRLDAELLVAAVLGGRARLWAEPERRLDDGQREQLEQFAKARMARVPVAYILGHKEFWSLELVVDKRVLIPRPETELLIEVVLRLLQGVRAPKILDVGTGSAAIAIALKRERPDAHVVAMDVSADALSLAKENALRHGVEIDFLQATFPSAIAGPFSAIVSNPPYVPTGALENLAPELHYEPRLALDGGPDGLSVIRELIARAPAMLVREGLLAMELGIGQAEPVKALLGAAGFIHMRSYKDLAGIERVVTASMM